MAGRQDDVTVNQHTAGNARFEVRKTVEKAHHDDIEHIGLGCPVARQEGKTVTCSVNFCHDIHQLG